MSWISILDRVPEPTQRVYVCVLGDGRKMVQTIAEYIPAKTVLYSDYCSDDFPPDDLDYDETIDDYWTPKGWYEWQSEPDIHWLLTSQVTHWMPLFELPKNVAA